jgi:hypothetical protein
MMMKAKRVVGFEKDRSPEEGRLLQTGPDLNVADICGKRCDGNSSRLKREEQSLEQRQVFLHVTVRGPAGYGRSQFLAESRIDKSRG